MSFNTPKSENLRVINHCQWSSSFRHKVLINHECVRHLDLMQKWPFYITLLKMQCKYFLLGLFWDFYFDIAVVVRERLVFVFFCSCSDLQTAEMRFICVCLCFLNPSSIILLWFIYQYLFLLIDGHNMTSSFSRPSAQGATGLILYWYYIIFFCFSMNG